MAIEKNGAWGQAINVPGLRALHAGRFSDVKSVSCTSPGNCSAGGLYTDASGGQAFVINENNGTWGQAIDVPGLQALNKDGAAEVTSVSCPPAGNCVAGGSYSDSHGHSQAFVAYDGTRTRPAPPSAPSQASRASRPERPGTQPGMLTAGPGQRTRRSARRGRQKPIRHS
jgi:hypothetical protein